MAQIWSFLEAWLYGPASTVAGWRGLGVRILRYPWAVVRDLTEGEISLRAMGLVYTTLLSLVPLIAFLFTILSIFGARRDLEPILHEFFRPLGDEGAAQMTVQVMQFASRANTRAVGSLNFVLLAWTVIGTIKRVEDSFNFVWHIEQARSLGRRTAEYLTLLVIGPLLLVTFITLTRNAATAAAMQEMAHLPFIQRLMTTLTPYLLVTAFFTALYLLIPNTKVQLVPALVGALVAGVLWAAVGKMFTAFVAYSAGLAIVYAGFAVIITALLWTYSGWIILLAGTLLCFYVQNPAYLRIGTRGLTLSGAEREELALALMYLVCQSHQRGGRLWTLGEVATQLEVPGIALSHAADALKRAGLLLTSEDGQLLPARDAGHITALEVLEAAYHQDGGHLHRSLQIPAVEQLLGTLETARRGATGELSLRELVEAPRALVLVPQGREARRGLLRS